MTPGNDRSTTSEERSSAPENRSTTSEERSINALLEEGIEKRPFTAAAAIVGGPGKTIVAEAVGTPTPDGELSTTIDTPFDLASLTKPIVTTTICLRLLERGELTLTDTLDRQLPETSDTKLGDVPIRTLLTHTSGLAPYRFSEEWTDRQDAIDELTAEPPFDRPIDDTFEYSCLNYVFLATVLRRTTGSTLPALAETEVFGPAGMETATVGPYESPPEPVAVTYDHEYRDRALENEIHDPIANVMRGESGNAGAFASARDVARFARTILRDADGDGTLLAAPTVGTLPIRRSGTDAKAQGYGWRVATDLIPTPGWAGRTIGHTGYTGTSLWISFDHDRFAVLLTNAVYEDATLYRFRQRFHGLAASLPTGRTENSRA